MTWTIRAGAILAATLLAVACGDDAGTTDDPGMDLGMTGPRDLGGGEPDLAPSDRDAFTPPGGERFVLAAGDWSMPAGQEGYICVRQTIDRTIFVHEFYPIAPFGTHHTVVTFDETPSTADGVTPCGAATNAPDMIYGSGVGTEPLTLPDGIAVEIPAGSQILVNLHLFNTTAETLTGNSGIEVVTMAEETVENRAEVILGGPVSFSIPAMTENHEVRGGCTMQDDVTIFAIMPHMHQLGTYMSVEVDGSMLFEDTYSFDEQRYRVLDSEVSVSGGTRINVRCRYDNPTSNTITFGDSSNQEMCFALLYRYPALGDGVICPF